MTTEPSGRVQIIAGNELAELIDIIRFLPNEDSSSVLFLHSKYDAEMLIWKWFLKWRLEK